MTNNYLPKTRWLVTIILLLTLCVSQSWGATNNGDLFERISAAPAANDEVIIVNSGETVAMSTTQNGNNRGQTSITTSSNQYIYASSDNVQVLTVKVDGTYYGFHTSGGSTGGFLNQPSNNNYLRTTTAAYSTSLADATKWSISVSSNVFSITSKRNTSYYIAYNSGSSIFSAYKSGQSKPYMYKKVMSAPTAVAASSITSSGATITITDGTNVNNYELYYSTSSTAPTASTVASTTITSGKSKTLTTLLANTTYYLWARAFSTSPARKTGWIALTGTTFTTLADASLCSSDPSVGASSNSSVNVSGATVTCASVTIGDCDIDEWGFVYGTTTKPTGNVTKKGENSSTNVSSYSHTLTGLNPGTKYYVRGYAKVGANTYYGSETNFTTNTITAATNDEDHCLVEITGKVITAVVDDGYQYASPAYTVSGGSAGSTTTVSQDDDDFTVTSNSTSNITVTINVEEIPTDHFIDGVHSTTGYTGTGLAKQGDYSSSIPSIADKSKPGISDTDCDDLHYHFVGWVTSANKADPSGHIVSLTGTADGTTYYAVWAQEDPDDVSDDYSLVKDASTLAAGDKLLVASASSSSAAVLGYQKDNNRGQISSVSISEEKMSPDIATANDQTTKAFEIELQGSSSGWYLYDAVNGYMQATGGTKSNYLTCNSDGSRDNDDTWTIAVNTTTYAATVKTINSTASNRGIMMYNSGSSLFSCYASGQSAIYLFRKAISFTDYITECAAVTCGTPTTPTSTPTAYGATLGWTEASPGTKSKYQYIVWKSGDTEPTSGFSETTSTSATVSGLLSNTTYRWKVRKVCTGTDGESTWLKSSFTTSTIASVSLSVPSGATVTPTSQASNVELPSASVPTNGADCWSFAGWTTAAYNGSSAPTKFFAAGDVPHLAQADGTTLRAVYVSKPKYRIISQLSEIAADEYYVLAFDRTGVSEAMSATVTSTYFTTATSINIKTDDSGPVIENPAAGIIWKFTGTTSAGRFYNENSSKYMDLHSASAAPVAASTTDYVNITVVNESKRQFNIESNTTDGNYLQLYEVGWGIDDEHDGYFSCRIFKRSSEATYTTAPPCERYTVVFDVNGDTHDTKYVTECAGYLSEMPDDPDDDELACAEVFMGWSAEELTGTGNDEPDDLFATLDWSPEITEDTKFYAVFATEDPTKEVATSVTSEFNSNTWGDTKGLWTSGKAGNALTSGRGVQITTGASGANATTKASYYKVTSVVVTYSTNASSGEGTIAIEVGGTGTTASATVSTSGGIDDRTITYTPTTPATYLTGAVKITVTCTTNSIYIKSVEINYTGVGYKDYVTYCSNEFTTAGNWNTAANWSLGTVPTIKERAVIKKAAVVNTTGAKARSVVIYNDGSSNTGSLEISAGQALVVAETVRKTTNGSTESATGENDIVFGSTLAAGTGALVMNGYTSGNNKATVNFAVKAKKDNDGWVNQFIGTPFNDQGAVLYNYYGTQLYAFHPANDGSYDSGTSSAYDAWWSRLAETDGMDPFMGYNILCSKAESPILWMQGTLNASSNVTFSSLAGGAGVENLLANSWMAPIHIGSFQNGDFTNVEKTIYIFNAGTPDDYDPNASGAEDAEDPGTYIVLPINSASWTDPTITVIPAMQAFSVFATGANPSLTLNYNRLVYTPALTSVGVVPTRAPRSAKAAEATDAPEVIRLRVAAESGYAANAYILGREDFNEGFDDGWDGRFMEGDYAAPQLYAPTENGNMVINCVPEIEGTVLCFKPGTADNDYTFSFSYEGEESWYLNDQKEQESTLISALDSYTFHSSADDMPARFVVSRTPIYKTPTGVEDADGRNQKSDVRKIVIDDHVFIIRNGLMYDVTGILCE